MDSTDLGTAAELAVRYGYRLRRIQSDGKWVLYDGGDCRWKPEDRHGSEQMAKTTVLGRTQQFGGPLDPRKTDGAMAERALKSARSMLAITWDAFDRLPTLVNAPNGVLDLETGDVWDPEPSMLLTKQTRAPLGTGARPSPLWLDHLRVMTHGDEELQRLLQIACGAALYGGTDKPQKFIFLRGEGRNGKGVFLQTLRAALGDYAAPVSKGLFTQADDAIPHELVKLRGARMAFCAEAPRQRVNAASINNLTGGDELQGRLLHGNLQASFMPTYLPLWISGNESLTLDSGANSALWKRCVFVDLGLGIPDREQDDSIARRLLFELEGVLAWVLEGWTMFQENGRRIPSTAAGEAMVEANRSVGDHAGRFMREALEESPGASTPVWEIEEAYAAWLEQHRHQGGGSLLTSLSDRYGKDRVSTPAGGGEAVLEGVRLRGQGGGASGFGALLGRAR